MQSINQLQNNPLLKAGIPMLVPGIQRIPDSDSIMKKVFTPQMRSYFDVDTQTVKNKIIKLLVPFKTFSFDDSIKKLELYLPIVSFMTLIMFTTLLSGLESKDFTPKIGKSSLWILIFTMLEVLLAKFTQNAVSNLNLGIFELICLVSYRFVSLSVVSILLVLTGLSIPFLRWIGIIYALTVDTFYCVIDFQFRNLNWSYVVDKDSNKKEGQEINWLWEFIFQPLLLLCGIVAYYEK